MKGLKEAFNKICKANDEVIKKGKSFNNCCFIIKEDGKIEILNLYMKDKNDKASVRGEIFKTVESQRAPGYIVILKTMETNEGKKESCVFRALYSMDDKISEVVKHEENKIVERERIFGRENENIDFWDLWQPGNFQ